jgi:hypothetical protein
MSCGHREKTHGEPSRIGKVVHNWAWLSRSNGRIELGGPGAILLGNVGILHLTHLKTTAGRNQRWEEILAKQCEITKAGSSQLLAYLHHRNERLPTSDGEVGGSIEGQYQLPAPQHPSCCPLVLEPARLPPCMVGRLSLTVSYERFVLEQCPGEMISYIEINQFYYSKLMDHMCTARAVSSYTADGESYFAVECLTHFLESGVPPSPEERRQSPLSTQKTKEIRNLEACTNFLKFWDFPKIGKQIPVFGNRIPNFGIRGSISFFLFRR